MEEETIRSTVKGSFQLVFEGAKSSGYLLTQKKVKTKEYAQKVLGKGKS